MNQLHAAAAAHHPPRRHGYPIVSSASLEKARELTSVLTRYQHHMRLYHVAFGEIQRRIVVSAPAPLRTVI